MKFWEASLRDLITSTSDYQGDGGSATDRLASAQNIQVPTVKGSIRVSVSLLDDSGPDKKDGRPIPADIRFEFRIPSQQNTAEIYFPVILFHNVPLMSRPDMFMQDEPTVYDLHAITDTYTGEKFLVRKLTFNYHQVQVHCTCPDFLHTFHPHHIDSAHQPYDQNQPLPQRRGKLINPKRHPGLCKHLLACINFLETRNLLRDSF